MTASRRDCPAFPYSALSPEGPSVYKDAEGLSVRDYAAIKMAAAMLGERWPDQHDAREIAKRAVMQADCLMDALGYPSSVGTGGTG